MIQPHFDEFKRLARKGNLVALRTEISSDLETPVSAFLKLESNEHFAFLFESAEQEERIGRYSFLGFSPEFVLRVREGEVYLERGRHSSRLAQHSDLLEVMQSMLRKYRLANPQGLPNFTGGFVGFLGYECVSLWESLSLRNKTGLSIDDAIFFLIKDFVLFDHFKKTLSIISLVEAGSDQKHLEKEYHEAVRRIRKVEARLRRSVSRKPSPVRSRNGVFFKANVYRPQFEKDIRRIKEYIRAGDCIQVVLSQRFHLGSVRNDFEIYRALRSINPSPYMFYFRAGSLRLIGSSPELLVKKTGREAELRPIAGTRPRGETTHRDGLLEDNLRRSVKEMAEHLMLVDLGRNDLGRVCEFSSVRVGDFARVEKYSHVMHLVSSVKGRLKPGKGGFDLLRATFPAGTVTGAPKIRAMEIIDELEPERRGPYAGCLGYFSFNQDMDMCLTIRTIIVLDRQAYVQAGAGVVYDSKPHREYEETVNKAKALVQAVHGRSSGRGSLL